MFGKPHKLHIRAVYTPGVGKRFALFDEQGKRRSALCKTQRGAATARYWKEYRELVM